MMLTAIKTSGVSQLAGAAVQQHPQSRAFAMLHFFAHWGGLGILPLAIIDSTIIPTFGSLDVLIAFLSARHGSLWLYYASMAITGSMIGSFLTYKLGEKTGLAGFERKFGARRSQQVEYALQRWGAGAVFVSTVAPPPCPASLFLFAAGGLGFNLRKFLVTVFSGRALRYGILTLVAAHYGRRIVRYMRHPGDYLWMSLLVTVLIIAATVLFLTVRKTSPVFSNRQMPQSSSGD